MKAGFFVYNKDNFMSDKTVKISSEHDLKQVFGSTFNLKKVNIKTINLLHSELGLDVIVSKDEETALAFMKKNYDLKSGEIDKHVTNAGAFVAYFEATKNHPTAFFLYLKSLDPRIICHELIHILYRFSELIKVELNKESQEWQARFVDGIFAEIMNTNEYWTLSKEDILDDNYVQLLKATL